MKLCQLRVCKLKNDMFLFVTIELLFSYLLDVYNQGFWGTGEVFQDDPTKTSEVVIRNKAYSQGMDFLKHFQDGNFCTNKERQMSSVTSTTKSCSFVFGLFDSNF